MPSKRGSCDEGELTSAGRLEYKFHGINSLTPGSCPNSGNIEKVTKTEKVAKGYLEINRKLA